MALLPALAVFAMGGCSRYQQLLKSTDYEVKYNRAVEYFNEKDYYRAYPLFEEMVSIYKGTKRSEKVYYYYSYCHYGLGEYALAAFHFGNLAAGFPNG